jgi:imidazoleglycerol phosphate synthase glutamine amidotransferase subunit HisH
MTSLVGSVKKVAILDYSSGNLRAAERALARVRAAVTLTGLPRMVSTRFAV